MRTGLNLAQPARQCIDCFAHKANHQRIAGSAGIWWTNAYDRIGFDQDRK